MSGVTTNYITDLGNVFVSYADLVATQPIATLSQAPCNSNGTIDEPRVILKLYAPTASAQTIYLQDKYNNNPDSFPNNNFIIHAIPGYTISLNLYIAAHGETPVSGTTYTASDGDTTNIPTTLYVSNNLNYNFYNSTSGLGKGVVYLTVSVAAIAP